MEKALPVLWEQALLLIVTTKLAGSSLTQELREPPTGDPHRRLTLGSSSGGFNIRYVATAPILVELTRLRFNRWQLVTRLT